MIHKTIKLKYSRKDLEELYFNNDTKNSLVNKKLIKEIALFVFFALLFIFYLIYIIMYNENKGFMIFIVLILSYSTYNWYQGAAENIKRKRGIKKHLNHLDKIKLNQIEITEVAFSLIQDEKETIEKWSNFKNSEIEENYITLTSNQHYFILPKKSMEKDEYEFLKSFISDKLKFVD